MNKVKKRRAKRPRVLSVSGLIAKLDRIFSRYIRLRDADESGICTCVTCGTRAPWNEMHAGHFVKRQHKAVRFDPYNVRAQCVKCNLYGGGCQDEFGYRILKEHGGNTLERLIAAKHQVTKWTRQELEEQIERYKEAVAAQEARLGL